MSPDTHALSGAYALDALDPEEAAHFEEHLAGCEACRSEVWEFREVAARLGASATEAPPRDLKERVLTHADRIRQEPPPVPAAPHVEPPPESLSGSPAQSRAESRADVVPLRRRLTVGLLAAAAAVVVAGVVGVQVIDRDDGSDVPGLATPAAQVFEAEDAAQATVPTSNGGELRVAVSQGRGEMAVDVRELPDPGPGRAYQLWTGHGEEMTDAGVLPEGVTGAAMPVPEPGDTVNVTVEPVAGSTQPTSEPIVTVAPASL